MLSRSLFKTLSLSDIGFELSPIDLDNFGTHGRAYFISGFFLPAILKPLFLLEYKTFCYFVTLDRKPEVMISGDSLSDSIELNESGYRLTNDEIAAIKKFTLKNRKPILKHFKGKTSSLELVNGLKKI